MSTLRGGIPTIAEVDQLVRSPLYQDYTRYNAEFLMRHGSVLAKYGRHWGEDPFGLWSRRWEYPYVGQALLTALSGAGDRPLKLLDAGSGVTFFDYLLCDRLPRLEVVCVDYDSSYHRMFADINAATPGSRVSFVEAGLQQLPHGNGSFDGIACLSVLEHTDQYATILREFGRVIAPGGHLVLTFDLSLDGKFPLSKAQASDLLAHLAEHFEIADVDAQVELQKMDTPDQVGLLTTDHVRRTQPELLPWRYPLLKGVHDLVKGHGWTGGFRSKAVFCLAARRR